MAGEELTIPFLSGETTVSYDCLSHTPLTSVKPSSNLFTKYNPR